ncbi:hypothetical protein C8A01DRAFT_14356 [Parachaetomium inaequale]|uniref:Putative zinc-finger domain-containing protein n=1 Tax=Parachaetomium inaequale TaxID=2588326 RepID=A0AAN6STR3_9PEZI|nr:hypothetical protein C8A01DRAFT_14356 [Parachaetomium inaequale]
MSQYPHPYGYGQYHGQYPPQQYPYQNVPGYPAPGHNIPYNPSAAPIHRDASQAAYDLNATYIPGLGMGGTAPVETQYNFAPGVTSWTQPPGFPASTPSVPPLPTYGATPFNPHMSQPATNGSRTAAQSLSQPAPTAPRPTTDVEMEEGELSEGQFEDLYEPREDAPHAPPPPVSKPLPLPIGDLSQPASAADTPDGGFYGTDEDEGEKAARGNEGRERSASYSPFLSPREIQSEIPTPQAVADKGAQPVVGTQKPAVPGLQPSTATSTTSGSSQTKGSTSQSQKDPLSSFRSLQEAKKEAQKAILRLWPLGVKYQNYLDEGFDEKLIKSLFLDLHLDMPKAATDSPAAQPKSTQPRQGAGADASKPSQTSDKSPQPAIPVAKDSPAMSEQTRKGEERKDRIARLLAAKAAKAPAAPNPPTPTATQAKQPVSEAQQQEAAPEPPTSVPPKSKTWGEKERLIQQKIAALQKSRAAQKTTTDTPGLGAVGGNNGAPTPPANTTGSPAPLSIPTGPRAANVSQTSASAQPTPSQTRPPLPSSALSPNVPQNASSQRKRPVASDFVEYSSGPVPAKRPFAQARKETSLIIDVSDESDDEEMDMDMDMGSPVDETLPIQSSGNLSQRGPAIRDFPPLTDTFPQRQFSSPAPSVTPPGGRVNNKIRETELGLKEKAIQDMRRRIALAEAKRKVKQSSGGSVTPNQLGPESKESETLRLRLAQPSESMSSPDRSDGISPQLTPEPSARLPTPSDMLRLDPLQRAQRRGRIMSLEIPRVELSLTEKMKRLEQLRDEQARLKAEIDRSMAEQRMLADELQQLDTAPPVESPPPNGLDPGSESGSSLSSHAVEETGDQEADASVSQTGDPLAEAQTGGTSSTLSVSDKRTGDVLMNEGSSERPQGESPAAESGLDGYAEHASGTTKLEAPLPEGDAILQVNTEDASVPSPESQPAGSNIPEPIMPEQVDTLNTDETTPMELDSRSRSPEVAEPVSSVDAASPVPLPDQISSAAQPREAVQEMETEVAGEVHVVSSCGAGTSRLTKLQVHDRPTSKSDSRLMPYESPLRYFHAYRFHPEYKDAVAGGLKSLTYSNRIDPEKELCPFELTGEQCPANCEFQHFGSISPPDDQILLELGNPDDYSGEQKSRFIQGLRELLQRFKAEKVKDFDTIARGIIEFRSQLLGDKSKVLRLEGVTI